MPYNILSIMPTMSAVSSGLLSVGEESLPPGEILSLDKSLLVNMGIQWLNIAILTVVLILILYKPVKKFMSDRAERIRGEIDSAHKTSEDAQRLKSEYESKIANIGKERDEILHKAHRAADAEHDRILSAAQEEAKHLIMQARDEIKLERDNAANEMRRQIIEVSTLMASRFIEISMDSVNQNKYIDEALEDWSGRTWQA